MTKVGFKKRTTWGPDFPTPHSLVGKPGKVPPDGDVQPDAEKRLRAGSRWMKDHAIGMSVSESGDFGPYINYKGEGLFHSFKLDFENTIPFSTGCTHPHVCLLLFSLALNLRPDVIVETGTFMGYSTLFLARVCDLWGQGMVYTFDPENKLIAPEIRNHPRVRCIHERSADGLPRLMEEVGQVDFAFLDSWKRLSLHELSMIVPFMVDGGIIAFHDTQWLNSGHTLYETLEGVAKTDFDTMLFAGVPHVDNPHHYHGHADDNGLYVLRKKTPHPFLDIPDADSQQYKHHQVMPRTVYLPAQMEGPDPIPAERCRLALAVSMYDEHSTMIYNMQQVGDEFTQIAVVQSDLAPHPGLEPMLKKHRCASYILNPNLYPKEGEGSKGERYDFGTRSIVRNFNDAFRKVRDQIKAGAEVDYVVGTYGDTMFFHLDGVRNLIAGIEQKGADIAVSRAMGQIFHRAELTWQEMADPDHPKGGRLQDESNGDFMPHLFIFRVGLLDRFCNIQITNRWCTEQILSDTAGDASRLVFSDTAYGHTDGWKYNTPSPTNWKHRGE